MDPLQNSKPDTAAIFAKNYDPVLNLALGNSAVLLARVHAALNSEKIDAVLCFYPGPDVSISSNPNRTRDGFPYGGVLAWEASRALAFPGIRPNGCGVLLCKLGKAFDELHFIQQVVRARDHFPNDWDYDRGNHFIAIYRDMHGCHYCLLHGGTVLSKNPLRPNDSLYPEINKTLSNSLKRVTTPSGYVDLLVDSAALEYYENFKRVEILIKQARESVCRCIWPSAEIVFHETHQGLCGTNTVMLGAYLLGASVKWDVVPIMVGPGEDLLSCGRGIPLDAVPHLSVPSTKTYCLPNDLRFSPHGTGDTWHNIHKITTNSDTSTLFTLVLKNQGRVIYRNSFPTPDYRPASDVDTYFRNTHVAAVDSLRHVVTCKI